MEAGLFSPADDDRADDPAEDRVAAMEAGLFSPADRGAVAVEWSALAVAAMEAGLFSPADAELRH